jgi:hypothetical protein
MATPENKLAFDGGWEYSPAPESTDHIKVEKKYELFCRAWHLRTTPMWTRR